MAPKISKSMFLYINTLNALATNPDLAASILTEKQMSESVQLIQEMARVQPTVAVDLKKSEGTSTSP